MGGQQGSTQEALEQGLAKFSAENKVATVERSEQGGRSPSRWSSAAAAVQCSKLTCDFGTEAPCNIDLCVFALNLAAIGLSCCCRFCANIRSQLLYSQFVVHPEPGDNEVKIWPRWLCSVAWPQATFRVQLGISEVHAVAVRAPAERGRLDGTCGSIAVRGEGTGTPSLVTVLDGQA